MSEEKENERILLDILREKARLLTQLKDRFNAPEIKWSATQWAHLKKRRKIAQASRRRNRGR